MKREPLVSAILLVMMVATLSGQAKPKSWLKRFGCATIDCSRDSIAMACRPRATNIRARASHA